MNAFKQTRKAHQEPSPCVVTRADGSSETVPYRSRIDFEREMQRRAEYHAAQLPRHVKHADRGTAAEPV